MTQMIWRFGGCLISNHLDKLTVTVTYATAWAARRREDVKYKAYAGVEGIESEAMLCCVEDRALESSLASSPIEPMIEPGVEHVSSSIDGT